MKCPKCGYENKDYVEHCDLCKEIFIRRIQEPPQKNEGANNTPFGIKFVYPFNLRRLPFILTVCVLLYWLVGQLKINALIDKVEKSTYSVKDSLSAKDKVKYDQAMAAIELMGKLIRSKVAEDGIFPSSIDDLKNVKGFEKTRLIDPFSENEQFVKYRVVTAGRGTVNIYSVGPDGDDDGGQNLTWNGRKGDITVSVAFLYPLSPPKTNEEKYGKEYEKTPKVNIKISFRP